MNNTIVLDVQDRHWTTPSIGGTHPPPRSYHASSGFDHLMIIHGGEAVVCMDEHGNPQPLSEQHRGSLSQQPSQMELPSTSAMMMNMSSSLLNTPAYEKTIGASKGVCPGDNLQAMKLGPAVRVSPFSFTYMSIMLLHLQRLTAHSSVVKFSE
jgi:hypothetical protein